MAKNLFTTKAASVKKKVSFHISADLINRLQKIEREAEKSAVAFPLNEHVEDAIERLVTQAEKQLKEISRSNFVPSNPGTTN